jgi:hypothetical protein
MHKLFIAILILNTQIVCAQKKYSAKQLRDDVDLFKKVADQLHPGFLYHTYQNEVNKSFEDLQKIITDSLTITDFFKKFNILVQSFGDLHTYASYKKQYSELKYALPFSTYSSDKKLWITHSYNSSLIPGDEIISINEKSVSSIIDEMTKYTINPDRAINPTNVFEIRHTFTVLYGAYFNETETADLKIMRDGKLLPLNIQQLKDGDLGFKQTSSFNESVKKIYETSQEEIKWQYIDSIQSVYLKIHSFDSFLKHMKTEKKIFKYLALNKSKNLIIDVRDNPGGNYTLAGFLIEYIADKPFNLVDSSIIRKKNKIELDKKLIKQYTRYRFGLTKDNKRNIYFLKTYKFRPRKKYNFNGNIILLINAQSMSTASILAGYFKNNGTATLIGEESGNNYCAFCAGGKILFELPNSRMRTQIPLNLLYLQVEEKNNNCNSGVIPDIEILESINDRINNRDVQLLKAIEKIKSLN